MQGTFFIWLGSRRTRKLSLSDKCKHLDQAAGVGLPVPNGAVLLDDFYHLLLGESLLVVENEILKCLNPKAFSETLYNIVRFPRLDNPVAVRSAFSFDQTGDQSQTESTSKLSVDFTDPIQLTNALCDVWNSACQLEPNSGRDALPFRRDILVMEMVNVQEKGKAITRQNDSNDEIFYSPSLNKKLSIKKLKAWKPSSRDLPSYAQRLQKLLRGVRRTFGKNDLRISWVDDGRICWLVGIEQID